MTYGDKEIKTDNVIYKNNVAGGLENKNTFIPTHIALLIPKNFTDFVIMELNNGTNNTLTNLI